MYVFGSQDYSDTIEHLLNHMKFNHCDSQTILLWISLLCVFHFKNFKNPKIRIKKQTFSSVCGHVHAFLMEKHSARYAWNPFVWSKKRVWNININHTRLYMEKKTKLKLLLFFQMKYFPHFRCCIANFFLIKLMFNSHVKSPFSLTVYHHSLKFTSVPRLVQSSLDRVEKSFMLKALLFINSRDRVRLKVMCVAFESTAFYGFAISFSWNVEMRLACKIGAWTLKSLWIDD